MKISLAQAYPVIHDAHLMSCNEKLVIQSLYNLIVLMNKNAFNTPLMVSPHTDISPETKYQANLQLMINNTTE